MSSTSALTASERRRRATTTAESTTSSERRRRGVNSTKSTTDSGLSSLRIPRGLSSKTNSGKSSPSRSRRGSAMVAVDSTEMLANGESELDLDSELAALLHFGERKANNAVDSAVNDTHNHTSYYERLNEEREMRKKLQVLLARENKAKLDAQASHAAAQRETERLETELADLKKQTKAEMDAYKREQDALAKQSRREMESDFRAKMNESQERAGRITQLEFEEKIRSAQEEVRVLYEQRLVDLRQEHGLVLEGLREDLIRAKDASEQHQLERENREYARTLARIKQEQERMKERMKFFVHERSLKKKYEFILRQMAMRTFVLRQRFRSKLFHVHEAFTRVVTKLIEYEVEESKKVNNTTRLYKNKIMPQSEKLAWLERAQKVVAYRSYLRDMREQAHNSYHKNVSSVVREVPPVPECEDDTAMLDHMADLEGIFSSTFSLLRMKESDWQATSEDYFQRITELVDQGKKHEERMKEAKKEAARWKKMLLDKEDEIIVPVKQPVKVVTKKKTKTDPNVAVLAELRNKLHVQNNNMKVLKERFNKLLWGNLYHSLPSDRIEYGLNEYDVSMGVDLARELEARKLRVINNLSFDVSSSQRRQRAKENENGLPNVNSPYSFASRPPKLNTSRTANGNRNKKAPVAAKSKSARGPRDASRTENTIFVTGDQSLPVPSTHKPKKKSSKKKKETSSPVQPASSPLPIKPTAIKASPPPVKATPTAKASPRVLKAASAQAPLASSRAAVTKTAVRRSPSKVLLETKKELVSSKDGTEYLASVAGIVAACAAYGCDNTQTTKGKKLKLCKKCNSVAYCSRECTASHLEHEHSKEVCRALKERLVRAIMLANDTQEVEVATENATAAALQEKKGGTNKTPRKKKEKSQVLQL